MKYSLMSLMLDGKLKVTKPSFMQLGMAWKLGFKGGVSSSMDEVLSFLNGHGVPAQNGTMTFEDFVRFASDSGYDGVDMMSFHFEEDGAKARDILKKYGIALSAINVVVPFINATDTDRFHQFFQRAKDLIDRAYEAGCRNVLLVPSAYRADEGITRAQGFQHVVTGLRACVAYGQGLGMTISTETLESMAVPLCSNNDMMRLFSAVPGLKYTHDTGNVLVAEESPTDTYEQFRDLVVAVHFKDLKGSENQHDYRTANGKYLTRADFGTGLVDFRRQLELFMQDGYDGFITLEGSVPAAEPMDGAVRSLRYFKDLETEIRASASQ